MYVLMCVVRVYVHWLHNSILSSNTEGKFTVYMQKSMFIIFQFNNSLLQMFSTSHLFNFLKISETYSKVKFNTDRILMALSTIIFILVYYLKLGH